MPQLTAMKITKSKAKDKPYKLTDLYGLYIHIMPTGRKYFRVKYLFNNTRSEMTLGEYPFIGLEEARDKAKTIRTEAIAGTNPKESKLETTPITFEDVANEWLDKKKKEWKPTHTETVVQRLEAYIFPQIGNMQIKSIQIQDIILILKGIERQGHTETAKRTHGIIKNIFSFAIASNYCPPLPIQDLRAILSSKKPVPRASITDESGIASLMKNIFEYPTLRMKNVLLFSAYTFCRPGEIRKAEWDEIDFDKKEWRIPAKKMKMKKEHRVPLSDQCIEILKNQKQYNSRWVFPSIRVSKPLSENGVTSALRNMGYEKDQMCAHGFRSMASTRLNEMNYKPDLIEKALAHGDDNNIRGIYNRADYFEERRTMMQKWADYLDRLANR